MRVPTTILSIPFGFSTEKTPHEWVRPRAFLNVTMLLERNFRTKSLYARGSLARRGANVWLVHAELLPQVLSVNGVAKHTRTPVLYPRAVRRGEPVGYGYRRAPITGPGDGRGSHRLSNRRRRRAAPARPPCQWQRLCPAPESSGTERWHARTRAAATSSRIPRNQLRRPLDRQTRPSGSRRSTRRW